MISVRASASQSGEQAAAGLEQVNARTPHSTAQMSAAEGCLRFINQAWTQFHAVGE